MGLLDQFTKISAQDPLKRLVNDATKALENKLQNSVQDLFSKGLKSVGFSSSISNELAARFSNSLKQNSADNYFRTSSTAIERLSPSEICANIFPKSSSGAKTSSSLEERDNNNKSIESLAGLSNNILQFPAQIGKYYIALKFKSYERTAPQSPGKLEYKNGIVLPIPRSLVDNHSMRIETPDLGIQGFILDSLQGAESALRHGEEATNDFFSKSNLADKAGAYLFATASSKLGGGLDQLVGATANPHVAAMFTGVDLKKYQFEWVFAPRNPSESITVKEICNQLRRNSLPTFSNFGGTGMFTYPDLCQIELYPWAEEGKEFIKYKPALLSDVSIDYAPNGIPSFFHGTNLPTFIKVSLSFVETEYFTAEDFGEGRRSDRLEEMKELALDFLGLQDEAAPEAGTEEQSPTNDAPATTANTTPEIVTGAKDLSYVKSTVDLLKPGQEKMMVTLGTESQGLTKVYIGRASITGNNVPSSVAGVPMLVVPPYSYYVYAKIPDGRQRPLYDKPLDANTAIAVLNGIGAVK